MKAKGYWCDDVRPPSETSRLYTLVGENDQGFDGLKSAESTKIRRRSRLRVLVCTPYSSWDVYQEAKTILMDVILAEYYHACCRCMAKLVKLVQCSTALTGRKW